MTRFFFVGELPHMPPAFAGGSGLHMGGYPPHPPSFCPPTHPFCCGLAQRGAEGRNALFGPDSRQHPERKMRRPSRRQPPPLLVRIPWQASTQKTLRPFLLLPSGAGRGQKICLPGGKRCETRDRNSPDIFALIN